MSGGDPGYRDRARRWLRGADAGWAWLLPRRGLLPALTLWSLWALFVHQRPVPRVGGRCVTPSDCRAVLGKMTSRGAGVLLELLAVAVLTVVVVYLLAAAGTAVVGHVLDLRRLSPRLFAPDDRELLAVGVVLVAALLAYVAGTVGAAYSLVGLAVLYVLYFPLLVPVAVVVQSGLHRALGSLPDPFGPLLSGALAVAVVVLGSVAQVAWWYWLGTAAARATRRGGRQPRRDPGDDRRGEPGSHDAGPP